MLTTGADWRTVEDRNLPWLRRAPEIRFEPGPLYGAPVHILERQVGVQHHDVERAVIEAVVALCVIRIRTIAAVPRQHEHVEIWPAVRVRTMAVMIPKRREHRFPPKRVAVNREK